MYGTHLSQLTAQVSKSNGTTHFAVQTFVATAARETCNHGNDF